MIIEVFPELCKVEMITLPNDHPGLSKRTKETTQSNEQTQPQTQQQQQGVAHTAVSQGRRWIFVLVVFIYLIISKLIARSSAN